MHVCRTPVTSTRLITLHLDCFYRPGLSLSRVGTDYLKHGQVVAFLPLTSSEHPPSSEAMGQRQPGLNVTPTYQILIVYSSSC